MPLLQRYLKWQFYQTSNFCFPITYQLPYMPSKLGFSLVNSRNFRTHLSFIHLTPRTYEEAWLNLSTLLVCPLSPSYRRLLEFHNSVSQTRTVNFRREATLFVGSVTIFSSLSTEPTLEKCGWQFLPGSSDTLLCSPLVFTSTLECGKDLLPHF